MSTYPNGKIPDHLLIRRGDFLLTAGTWAKFDDLVARVKKRTGVTLRISTGSTPITRGAGAFRTYAVQVLVKAYWVARGQGKMAATPGTSSHGGEFKGRDALAIDINNYTQIPLSVFFEEGRKAGFEMGYFDGRNGRPYEPWHIIDRDPYRRVTPAGGNSKPVPKPEPTQSEEDETMFSVQINGNQYGVSKQFITHYGDARQAKITRQVTSGRDELHNLGNGNASSEAGKNWASLLDGLGIPRNVLDGAGRVLNPQSGKFEANGTWSREREILAALKK